MGLAMAREARRPANESGARPGVVYASNEVHMSVAKAVAMLGLRIAATNDLWLHVDGAYEDVAALVTEVLAAGRSRT